MPFQPNCASITLLKQRSDVERRTMIKTFEKNRHWVWAVLLLLLCVEPRYCAAAEKSALLVVDMQGCFLPGGPVAVQGDPRPVVEAINGLRQNGGFHTVVWTQDWHPPNHVSFAPVHSKQPQHSLQLSYTCVGNMWTGKGPRLCNMTQLYPNPAESVTCIDHQHDTWQHHDDRGSTESSTSGGATNGMEVAGSSSNSSGWAGRGQSGIHQNATDAGHAHGLAAAAANLADRISKFGCPEPVTEVQQVLWPPHCVRFTADARLHPGLMVLPQDLVVRKGWQPYIDAYSAFEDNGKLQSTGLAAQLRQQGIRRVVIAGVALDFCVMWTALDCVDEGFETVLVLDATLPVSAVGGAAAVQRLRKAGVQVVARAQQLHTRGVPVTQQ